MGRVPALFFGCGGVRFLLGFLRILVSRTWFLRGKRGEVVVICVAGSDSKRLAEIGSAFLHIYEFIFVRVPVPGERLRDPDKKKGRPEGRPH
jgi:hypothetical protein